MLRNLLQRLELVPPILQNPICTKIVCILLKAILRKSFNYFAETNRVLLILFIEIALAESTNFAEIK